MIKVTESDLKKCMEIFHKDSDTIYEKNNMGFSTESYVSESYVGILFKVENEKIFDTSVSIVSDDEICNKFKEFSASEDFKNTDELKEFIEFRDVRGFVSHGWFMFKGPEDFKWNKYTTNRDLAEIKRAIFKAGRENKQLKL